MPLPGEPPWNLLPPLNDLQLSAPPSRPPIAGRCYGVGKTSSRTVEIISSLCALFCWHALLYMSGLYFSLLLKHVVPRSMTSFKRQWKTEAWSMAKASKGTRTILQTPLASSCGPSGECNLLIDVYPAYQQGIVCSRKVCSKLKQ